MKKSIKYAGIAAATLLAVAPVAAPVVSSTETTVQADTVDYTTADGAAAYLGQFADKTYATGKTPATTALVAGETYGTNLSTTPTDVFGDALIKESKVNTANDTSFASATNAATVTSVQAYLANSKTALSVGDINKNLELGNAVTFEIAYSYKTSASATATTGTKAITFTPAAATATTTKAAVTYTTPISVEANSNPVATQLDSSVSNVSVKDQTGTELVGNTDQVASVTPGNVYYATLKSAEANGSTGDASLNTDDTFKADTTYYQNVTVTSVLGSSLDTYLKAQAANADGTYTINGVSYANTNNGTIAKGDDSTAATITLTRAINAGSESALGWTVEDVKGVVTTKSDSAYYTLNNDDNNTIANRALAKNSAWITDQKRTNTNGDVQYRVATGEWIDANDVTFSDKATTDEGAYTDEQALNGKVTLDGPSSFIYMLYNDNGEAVSNRALAGDSAWYTDKKATNAAGVTVYHVATGEWVQAGSGVNYVAY